MPSSESLAAQRRPSASPSAWPDRLAIGASAACLAHCLLPPLLIALAPATSRLLAVPEEYHVLALAFAVPVSAWAMIRGYRYHGVLLPASLGVVGILLLGLGALAEAEGLLETGLSLAGSLILAAGHVRNRQLRDPRVPATAT